MLYTKTYKTVEEQADLLIRRGLVCNRDTLIERLNWINYYRLSGYLFPFRKPDSDDFVEGTNLDQVWERYCFDRKFRLLMLDGIARIEVGLKTAIVLVFAREYGPFGYKVRENLPNISYEEFLNLQKSMLMEMERSKAPYVVAFKTKYGDSEENLPLWMAIELICAHHERLWNRVLGVTPVLYPKNKSKKRLFKLLESYPNIPLCEMGFPEDWKKTPFFAEVA